RSSRSRTAPTAKSISSRAKAASSGSKPPSEWGAERAPRQQRRRRSAGPERRAHDFLRFLLDAREVLRAAERLGVYFVDVLGAAGARGEPTVFGHDLQSAEA